MNRRLGIASIILLMIAIAVWVALPKHRGPSGPVVGDPVAAILVHASRAPATFSAVRSVEKSNLWARPAARVAARNLRRVKFAGLKRLGASETLINRLTDGDIPAVIAELNQRARGGDAAAANILEYMARLQCEFARSNAERSDFQAPELLDAQALPKQDAEWIRTTIQEQKASDSELAAACVSIDSKEMEGWVAKAADQGNAASRYLR